MGDMTRYRSDDGPAQRLLVATAVTRYFKAPTLDLPDLASSREKIITLFTSKFGYTHVSDLGLDPTEQQLTEHLRALCRYHMRSNDYLVVYIAAHGEVLNNGRHVVLTSDSDPEDLADALPAIRLADKMLLGTPVKKLLLLLDTCYSGQGGNQIAAAALAGMERDWPLSGKSGFVVVTSAQPVEQAGVGIFPTLLAEAVDALPTTGHAPATLDLGAIVEAMNRSRLRPPFQQVGWASLGLTGNIPDFLPNPRHRVGMTDVDLQLQQAAEWEENAERREVEFRRRFLIRAMGGYGEEAGWWFTGRHAALTEITEWLNHQARSTAALVVTGGPGSGKTAVLGLVSALTHPERRRTVPLDALKLPAEAIAPVGSLDVIVYAGGLTGEQVLAGLAAAARVTAESVGQFLSALGQRDRPFTALIDALDEAADPRYLITRILRPLIEHGHGQTIRLIVGTRPHLLSLLGPTGSADRTVISLDDDRYADPRALVAYTVRGLLEASPHSPYLNVSQHQRIAVATVVAEAAGSSFLVARITSSTLAAASKIADPTNREWAASLPRLPGPAMRNDLDIRLGPDAERARDLLRPLAYAQGQGLPWEDIWAALASKISGYQYNDEDLMWLRRKAGSYVVEATESGRSAYRLYHQALAEHLQENHDRTAIERDIVEVLTNRVPRDGAGNRDWAHAHPYTRHHLASHAAVAGALDDLLTDIGFLINADPDTLLASLPTVTTPEGQLTRTIYRASAHRHRHMDPHAREQLLAIDATRWGDEHIRSALCSSLPLRPRWATDAQISAALRGTLSGITGGVYGVASTLVGETLVAITVGDMTVRVWDLLNGERRMALKGHTAGVRAVACTEITGTPTVVTGDGERNIHIWDLVTGQLRGTFSHPGGVRAVSCTHIGKTPVAVTGGGDGIVRVWDLAKMRLRAALTGHAASVEAVACAHVHGVPLAVTGSRDATALVWDLKTGRRVSTLSHPGRVHAVAISQIGEIAVTVTGANDSIVRIWEIPGGRELRFLTGHKSPVAAVACTESDGIPIAVTGSSEAVRVWDLGSGRLRTTLTGHTGPVHAVACTDIDSTPVAMTGGGDNTLRTWDLTEQKQRVSPLGHPRPVIAIACSQIFRTAVTVSGSGDNTVHVRELATGKLRGSLSAGRSGWLRTLACTNIGGIPVAVTGSKDAVRVWNLTTGQQRAVLTGHTKAVTALACTQIGRTPVAVTGARDAVEGVEFDDRATTRCPDRTHQGCDRAGMHPNRQDSRCSDWREGRGEGVEFDDRATTRCPDRTHQTDHFHSMYSDRRDSRCGDRRQRPRGKGLGSVGGGGTHIADFGRRPGRRHSLHDD